MTHPKRLIELTLPLQAISEQSAREKSIRHGHISTLHIWWARRPLAAMRAAIFAALVPAPPPAPQGGHPPGALSCHARGVGSGGGGGWRV